MAALTAIAVLFIFGRVQISTRPNGDSQTLKETLSERLHIERRLKLGMVQEQVVARWVRSQIDPVFVAR